MKPYRPTFMRLRSEPSENRNFLLQWIHNQFVICIFFFFNCCHAYELEFLSMYHLCLRILVEALRKVKASLLGLLQIIKAIKLFVFESLIMKEWSEADTGITLKKQMQYCIIVVRWPCFCNFVLLCTYHNYWGGFEEKQKVFHKTI